ncbi:MAG: hypothetical protein KAV82_06860 [Phycisphaerae bacterium]|nr:hypothetical protein [Phycisphaerae bacterium]
MHQFAPQYAGRLARCPKLNRRFRVPSSSGSVAFIVDIQPEPAPRDDEKDIQASSGTTSGWLVKRVSDLYQSHKQKRELYRQTHCRCLHCKAENLTVDFLCTRCGCPLHDPKTAFLFMEKRRQEAHELKVAQAKDAQQQATLPPVARQVVAQPKLRSRIEQKVIVHQGSGCLTLIGATTLIILIILIIWFVLVIPICSGVLSSTSYPGSDRESSGTARTDTTLPPLGPATTSPGGGTRGQKPGGSVWASAKQALRQGDVELRITRVLVGKVPLRGGFDDRETTSQDELLAIHVEITNRSQSKKVEYQGWLGRDFAFNRDYATLEDNFGNRYKRINFGIGTKIVGHVESESIYPGKSLGDVIVFELPVDTAEYLNLELPAKNFGGDGMLRLRIPAGMIQRR